MAFINMWSEVHGSVPKFPIDLAKTFVNRAWKDVRRRNLWSFQLFEYNWVTANLLGSATSNGTYSCNVTQSNNQVVFNPAAANAINNMGLGPFPPAFTNQQFRVGVSTIYDLISWDGNNTAILDRPYTDASANNSAFVVGSYYFAAPYSDFVRFLSIVDMIDFQPLNMNRTREFITRQDPQLVQYFWPTDAVPLDNDPNPNSNTYGNMRYLLWGLPQVQRTYQLYGIREGADLVNSNDTLPFAIGEDVVIALALRYAYSWALAQSGDMPRAQGPDWRFLIGETSKDYDRLFRDYRRRDRERVDNWFTVLRPPGFTYNAPFFNSITGTAWPGQPF